MVVERLIHPASKLATTRLWHTTTLAQELGLGVRPGFDLRQVQNVVDEGEQVLPGLVNFTRIFASPRHAL